MKKPKLLSPCGSHQSLLAAISAGADECYFGGNIANARMNARGFSDEEFADALRLTRLYGLRSNITLNTLCFDRELTEAVEFAKKATLLGADAFIVQDMALARLLSERINGVELHASTQCACHNLDGAKRLASMGFSRIVLARELSLSDIEKITDYGISHNAFETEIFIHGALCVCHSGMCLMSSVIGGRSGNRGLCAQPCRMNGSLSSCDGKSKNGIYPLSLRDLSLCQHIKELSGLGVASLKIEGRMKSPEYVYSVTGALRNLLDEKRDADDSEKAALSNIFSRGGFTDRYFTGGYLSDNSDMYGFRSDADKKNSAEAETQVPMPGKIPLSLTITVKKDTAPVCRAHAAGKSGEFSLSSPAQSAKNAPLTKEALMKNISKLGGTEFYLHSCQIDLDDGLFMAASEINALRRGALDALMGEITKPKFEVSDKGTKKVPVQKAERKSAPAIRVFTDNPGYVKDDVKFPEALESICLPLHLFDGSTTSIRPACTFGVRLPEVIFEEEIPFVEECLDRAAELGAKYVYLTNIGHIDIAKRTGLLLYGGPGLNITNSISFEEYAKMGFASLTVSSELKVAQIRDIARQEGVSLGISAYGRLPLMVLEACILRGRGLCRGKCDGICGEYTDRIGKKFKVQSRRRFIKGSPIPCRNIILNAEILRLYNKKDKIQTAGADIWEIYDNQ